MSAPEKEYSQWAVRRYVTHQDSLVEDLRSMGERGQSMMIGEREHDILGIRQVITLTENGTTSDVIVLLDVQPK